MISMKHAPLSRHTTCLKITSYLRTTAFSKRLHTTALEQFSRNLPRNTVVRFVPQQQAWIVERMGKFHKILQPGLALLIPLIDRIRYVQSLKENAIEVVSQSAITLDNVTLQLDGVLYTRIFDAYKASYGVEDVIFAISQLAKTSMRSEIGQLTLDHVLRERQGLNHNITTAINNAANEWGITCLRYEIRDIHPPKNVLESMHRQVSAERAKRAEILDSEGQKQAAINRAEGLKQAAILSSEGDSLAIKLRAAATAQSIKEIATTIQHTPCSSDAISLQVAEQYVKAFGHLAKESNTIILPSELGNLSSLISSGLGIMKNVTRQLGETQQEANRELSTKPVRPRVSAKSREPVQADSSQ